VAYLWPVAECASAGILSGPGAAELIVRVIGARWPGSWTGGIQLWLRTMNPHRQDGSLNSGPPRGRRARWLASGGVPMAPNPLYGVSRSVVMTIIASAGVVIALLLLGLDPAKVAVLVAVLALVSNVIYVVATQRLAYISERTLAAQIQPIILDVSLDPAVEDKPRFPTTSPAAVHRGGVWVVADGSQAQCSLPVQNLGKGPARIRDALVQLTNRDGDWVAAVPHFVRIERRNLPPGPAARPEYMTRINFAFQGGDRGYSEWYHVVNEAGKFSVDVDYTDYAGGHRTITRFALHKVAEPDYYPWEVESVEFRQLPVEAN